MWVRIGNHSVGVGCGVGMWGRSGAGSSRLQVGVKALRCAPVPTGRPFGPALTPTRRLLLVM